MLSADPLMSRCKVFISVTSLKILRDFKMLILKGQSTDFMHKVQFTIHEECCSAYKSSPIFERNITALTLDLNKVYVTNWRWGL